MVKTIPYTNRSAVYPQALHELLLHNSAQQLVRVNASPLPPTKSLFAGFRFPACHIITLSASHTIFIKTSIDSQH